MKTTLKATIAAVLLGTATLAVAQSPAELFADRIKQFQALSAGRIRERSAAVDTNGETRSA